MPIPGRRRLEALLLERNRDPDAAVRIDREICASFGRRAAVLALDMCDFTQTTSRRGIIHYLARIDDMSRRVRPIVKAKGGRAVKQEADNLFAVFPRPEAALEAALAIDDAFAAFNGSVPAEQQISVCFGIGYGDILLVGRTDLFGAEVNLACKLGEDLAGRGEILLTKAAHDGLPPGRYGIAERRHFVAGVELEVFQFETRLTPARDGAPPPVSLAAQ